MSDYIEREAALLEVEEWADTFCECDYVFPHILKSIKKLPAADVRPVARGKWIQKKSWTRGVCSACSWEIAFVTGNSYNFCPNCGADMREES